MVLGKAAAGTPIGSYVKPGKIALKGEHRSLVSISDDSSLSDSVNLKKALSSLSPSDPQWDYAVGWIASKSESCCFVEVHPANTRQADEIVRKKMAAGKLLLQHAPKLIGLAEQTRRRIGKPVWHWVATDAHVAVHPGTPAARRLAEAGVSMPTRRVKLT